MATLGLCGAVLAMLVGGCGASARDGTAEAKPSVPLYSEGAAAAAGGALLAAVPLPADTRTGLSAASSGRRQARTSGKQRRLRKSCRPLRLLVLHRPPGSDSFLHRQEGADPKVAYSSYGGTRGKTEGWSETLNEPLASPLAGPRQLFVSIALDGSGHYAVRVDAVVAWHKRRPANSLVPATARWLKVTITTPAYRAMNPGEPSHAHTTTHSVITTAPATVRAVARAVNELPIAEPAGATPSCPEEGFANTVDAPRYRLVFRSSASAGNLAQVIGVSGYVCERGGADTAKITTPEDPQGLQLTDHLDTIGPSKGEGLTEHIELAFHHSLHLVPED